MSDEYLAESIYALLSKPVTVEKLTKAVEMGMIAKWDLEDGSLYVGTCRNANSAIWRAERQCFEYMRYKFGDSFPEDIVHPQDDDGSDIFVPMRKV